MIRPRLALVLLAVTLTGAAVLPPVALAACPQTSVADLEDEVMCPVCGVPLALATEAPQAQRERSFILDMVEDCRSKQEIKDALVGEFGPSVLATPATSGFDLAAWAIPAIAILVGMLAIGLVVVHRRRDRPTDDSDERPPNAAIDDASRLEAEEEASVEEGARLDRDLRRYDL